LLGELSPGQALQGGGFAQVEQRIALPFVAQNVFGKIQLRAGKPLSTRHPAITQHRVVWATGLHPKVIPDRLPESVQIIDRSLP
jgi:hypothetical protein